jgi:hypothetical protein
MPRYYFDMREGGEAARTLADMARDAIRGSRTSAAGNMMSIEVRDDAGPVLQLSFNFELRQLRH